MLVGLIGDLPSLTYNQRQKLTKGKNLPRMGGKFAHYKQSCRKKQCYLSSRAVLGNRCSWVYTFCHITTAPQA
ncbi:hypothetical protein B5J92_01325 [Moraxella atlantae]|uniref:Uncharacterized protein n=1 Tax=Faucicola atlantae TaxID=34059 RepID=A0A1B8QBL2_9GAMM|nr:hypothetical protein A9306_01075 [Moraxella atlantae]OPH37251.1 hypothetical protein B5J92_01325 [Moraxella atlantae]